MDRKSSGVDRREVMKLVGSSLGAFSAVGNVSATSPRSLERLDIGMSYETSAGETISVQTGTVKQSFSYLPLPDSPRVHGRSGVAYAFGEVESEVAEEPSKTSRSSYSIVVDGTGYPIDNVVDSVGTTPSVCRTMTWPPRSVRTTRRCGWPSEIGVGSEAWSRNGPI